MSLQAVKDAATDQNFRQVEKRFPLGPQDLSDSAKELFLQLVSSQLGLKVDVGTGTFTFSTSKKSNEPTVSHDLGVAPAFASLIIEAGGGSETQITWRLVEKSESSVKFYANSSVSLNVSIPFLWIALG